MDNLYTIFKSIKTSLSWLVVFAFIGLFSFEAQAQFNTVKPFTKRVGNPAPSEGIFRIRGDYTMYGNTNLTLFDYGDNTQNGGNEMIYVNVDENNTINSSSSNLVFSQENGVDPNCSEILYAGLYWSGRSNSAGYVTNVPTGQFETGQVPVDDRNDYGHNDQLDSSNPTINSSYTLTIDRVGSNNNYSPRYTFSSPTGDDYVFYFANDPVQGSNYVYYTVNGGSNQFPADQNRQTNNPGNGQERVTFSPVTITDGNVTLSIDRLTRNDSENGNENSYRNGDNFARITLRGFIQSQVPINIDLDKRQVRLKGPGDSDYTQIQATDANISYTTTGVSDIFVGYRDITQFVKSRGQGAYTVADIALSEGDGGGTGFFGQWAIVVVYQNSYMPWRDITLFDGFSYVESGSNNSATTGIIDITGFKATQNGDINLKLGVMAGEGDRGISGDFLEIAEVNPANPANLTGNFIRLSHPGNSTSNFFNSSIYTPVLDNNGVLQQTPRSPSILNNTGIDIAMWNVPNDDKRVITNGQTTTQFRYGTSQDLYALYFFAFAVDAFVPEIQALQTLTEIEGQAYNPNGPAPTVLPGGLLQYTVDVRNRGSEAIDDVELTIPMPFTASFVSASAVLNFSPENGENPEFILDRGATGSIVWPLGDIPATNDPNFIIATLTYTVKATEDCFILANFQCDPYVSTNGTISGTGVISGTEFNAIQFVQGFQDGTCEGEPIIDPLVVMITGAAEFIEANCQVEDLFKEFFFCNINQQTGILVEDLRPSFPLGTRFFNGPNEFQFTEFDDQNSFPAVNGTNTYYAIPPNSSDCVYEFDITVTIVETTPELPNEDDLVFCVGSSAPNLNTLVLPSNFGAADEYEVFFYTTEIGGSPTTGITIDTSSPGIQRFWAVEGFSISCLGARVPVEIEVLAGPDAGSNGTLTICEGTTPTNEQLFAALTGTPDTGGSWSNDGNVYTYTVAATAPCDPATATVSVSIQEGPDAGSNGTLTICEGTTPTNEQLFAALTGTPDAGGSWSNDGNVYTYTVAATAPCTVDATATVTVSIQEGPDAGSNGTLTICEGTTPTNEQLFAALTGTPDAGGSWSNDGNVYTYTVAATAPCTIDATATVTVSIQEGPDAGSNGTLTICEGTTPTNEQLFAALTGTPDAGGSWSNDGNVYTYTVAATAPCTVDATATVTVSIQEGPDAGSNGTLTICEGTTPTNEQLFAALTGTPDAGGSWSNDGNVYTYTVAATAPCTVDATATVTVSIQEGPDAGSNGTLTICEGTTPTNEQLFAALTGTPDAGGSWSNDGNVYTYTVAATAPCTIDATATVTVSIQEGPDAGSNGTLTICEGTTPTNEQLFAALTGTPDAGGSWSNDGNVYTYTVAATAPCTVDATATVTVSIQEGPDAGSNGTLTICEGTTPTNEQLFAALTGTPDAGGSWSNDGNVYTYTVAATAPCTVDATATVTVSIQEGPDAGSNGTLTICEGTTPTNEQLFAALTGTPDAGGNWSNDGNVYTYTVAATAPCTVDATATVTVSIQEGPDAGSNGTLTICEGTTPTNEQLFAALTGTPDAGGSWSNDGNVYTYTVAATAPCTVDATATVTVSIQEGPDAGSNGTLTICEGTTPTNEQLFAALTGTPDAGGSWSNDGNVYTYTVAATAPCTVDATATVTVSIQEGPDAGSNGTLTICEGTTPTNEQLFAALTGTPDAGGSWSNDGNVYTYTVAATAPCTVDATATVTVSIQEGPDAGSNGTLTICEGTTPTNEQLFAALTGTPDAGGSWSNDGNVYTYTVAATAPCTVDATATVTVSIQEGPDAGSNGTLTICEGTTPTNEQLFAALTGTPDAGGSWSNDGNVYTYTVAATAPCTVDATATVTVSIQEGPDAGSNGTLTICEGTTPTNEQLFAALTGTPDAGGSWSNDGNVYTYTVAATAPCTVDATATVTVSIQEGPDAGSNGTLTICEGTTPTNEQLFAALTGTPDAGGSWSNDGNVYTYTVAATAPCTVDATATVTVSIQEGPDAGSNGTLTICEGTTPTNEQLFAALTGTPDAGGSWSNDGNVYTYTVAATAPCTVDATATVTVSIQEGPDAGSNGTLTICEGTTPTNEQLFAALTGTPDAGGSWSNDGNVYTYTVAATAPCTVDATATVTVSIQEGPDAGSNGTLTICEGTTPTNEQLFAALTGTPDAGGSWSNDGNVYTYTVAATAPCTVDATATVTVTEGVTPDAGSNGTLTICEGTTPTNEQLFAALTGTPDAGGSWSNDGNVYTYTVAATAPCTVDATATVTVSIQEGPDAGSNGTLTICEGTTPTNEQLFAALTGTPDAGGSWSNDGNVYTYTVAATAPCTVDATATVTVSIQEGPDAGSNGTLTICEGTTPTNEQLFAALTGTPDAGGSWSNDGNVYTYTVAATAPCTVDATATVTVTEGVTPDAGSNGTLTICEGTTPTNEQLFAALTGTPDAGGSWSNDGNVYTYTVAATAPCTVDATATVTVSIQEGPDAGSNGTLTICEGTTPTNEQLFAALTGTPDAGGSWSNDGNVYTYTVAATAPCTVDATATVTVSIQEGPDAGSNGTLTICEGTTPTNEQLFAALTGTPDAGGSWSNDGNVYTYTVAATAPCTVDATATVTVSIQEGPDAGSNGTLTICEGTTPTNEQLFAALTGTPDAGGSWSNDGNVYTYTVAATAPCTVDATATVTVSIQEGPDAGSNGTLTICEGTTPTNEQLFAALTGTPDAGGSWSNDGNVYTYTVAATAPCTVDATATVTVSIQEGPDAGSNGTLTICEGTTPTNEQLFAALTGTPDAGGSWSNDGNVYTYTVAATAPCTVDATATVTVSIQEVNAPITSGNQEECALDTIQTLTAVATVEAGATLVWYDAPENGNVVSDPSWNEIGSITYYAEAVSTTGCKSERVPVKLTINACSIELLKEGIFMDENNDGFGNVGETVSYSFTVTNTGTVSLSGVIIQDAKVAVQGGPISLAPGASDNTTFTAIYVLTQEDITKGFVSNVALVIGTTPSDDEVRASSSDPTPLNSEISDPACEGNCTITLIPQNPSIELVKAADKDVVSEEGEVVTYTLTVTNTGNLILTNINVSDPLTGFETIIDELLPGESEIFTTSYTVTIEDIASQEVIVNVAKVTADDPTGTNADGITDEDEARVAIACENGTLVTGVIFNSLTEMPLAGVPVTLIPQGDTAGETLIVVTGVDGRYSFKDVVPGSYLVQVQDANLNSVRGLYPTNSSLFFTTLESCVYQTKDFGYETYDGIVLGDFVWYDLNGDGIQNEWYDSNNDNEVSQNVIGREPISIREWEWFDFNGDGRYDGPENEGELNKAGFGNAKNSNIQVTGPNGYSNNVIVGILGYWRTRLDNVVTGDYSATITLDENLSAEGILIRDSGKVKNLPNPDGRVTGINELLVETQCGLTTEGALTRTVSATQRVILDMDFGLKCTDVTNPEEESVIVANNDDFGTRFISFGGLLGNILENDLLNGVRPNDADVDFEFTDLDGLIGLLINENGELSLIPGVNEAREYTLKYTLRETVFPDNSDDATVIFRLLNDQVDLSVSKTSFEAEIFEGDEFEYEITINNIGGTPATNVELIDELPNAVTYISSRTESVSNNQIQVALAVTAGRLTWTIPFLPADANVVIRVRVKAGSAGSITNVARVSASEDDTNESNNQDSDVNQILPFHIPNVITPNQDGDNDTFEIQGLGKFVSNEIVIINRYGDHVFKTEGYRNDWNAPGQVAGTYFYILTTIDNSGKAHTFKGWIQVIKD